LWGTGEETKSEDKTGWLGVAIAVAILLSMSGCMWVRTVYPPHGKAGRIRADVKAKIWIKDKDGKEVPSSTILKEGWYYVPSLPQEDK
jgi:uncharacterized protein YceK